MPATKTTIVFSTDSDGVLTIRRSSEDINSFDAKVAFMCLTETFKILDKARPVDLSLN